MTALTTPGARGRIPDTVFLFDPYEGELKGLDLDPQQHQLTGEQIETYAKRLTHLRTKLREKAHICYLTRYASQ